MDQLEQPVEHGGSPGGAVGFPLYQLEERPLEDSHIPGLAQRDPAGNSGAGSPLLLNTHTVLQAERAQRLAKGLPCSCGVVYDV